MKIVTKNGVFRNLPYFAPNLAAIECEFQRNRGTHGYCPTFTAHRMALSPREKRHLL